MDKPELLPCPHCGCEAEYLGVGSLRHPWGFTGLSACGWTVVCPVCGATIPSCMDIGLAAAEWNRRHEEGGTDEPSER